MSTSLFDTGATALGHGGSGHGRPASAALRLRARLPWAVVGVLLIVGSALVFAVLLTNAGDRRPVLALSRPVAAGEVIEAADLRVVRVAADPETAMVPAGERPQVVGRVAAVSLARDSLLVRSQLGAGAVVGRGQAVVGLALKSGQLPLKLSPGDRVMVVRTGSPGGASPLGDDAATVLARGATVEAVREADDSSGTVVVSVVVSERDAPPIAGSAGAGRITLVQVAP